MLKKKSRVIFKIYDYDKKGIKSPGIFITRNLMQIRKYSDGREILVDISHKPYLIVIKFPINFTQDDESRNLLKEANTLCKNLIKDMVLDGNGKLACRSYGAFRSDTESRERKTLRIR